MIRVGLGSDIHRLIEGRRLLIGGVAIPFPKGEDGHSDGDVLLHAITDAVLGAVGFGDIGELFPPSDAKWKDANSADLLQTAWSKVHEDGWNIINIDCVISLEQPKLLPYRAQICKTIANILDCKEDSIFVKAKTGEKIGEIGKGEAISAYAVCLLEKF